jgi:hypothetical protein
MGARPRAASEAIALTLDSWLHFGHALSAIVWVGGGLMLSIVGLFKTGL